MFFHAAQSPGKSYRDATFNAWNTLLGVMKVLSPAPDLIPTNQNPCCCTFSTLHTQSCVHIFLNPVFFPFDCDSPSAVSHKSILRRLEEKNLFLWPSRPPQSKSKEFSFLLSKERLRESGSFSRSVVGFGQTRLWLNAFFSFWFRLKRGENAVRGITVCFLGKTMQSCVAPEGALTASWIIHLNTEASVMRKTRIKPCHSWINTNTE